MPILVLAVIAHCAVVNDVEGEWAHALPITIGAFDQQVHYGYTATQGLPDNDVCRVGLDAAGRVVAETARGEAAFDSDADFWRPFSASLDDMPADAALAKRQASRLKKVAGADIALRSVAAHGGETAAATDRGLYLCRNSDWRLALPQQGAVRWAPTDVRAVAYDAEGCLWFAAPQGVGRRLNEEEWRLYTGADGVPFTDFTCMAAGPRGVWFGTTNGAIFHQDGVWAFRQGGRWLLDNHVRDMVVDDKGDVWIATKAGVSRIACQPMTSASKAAYYEAEIEKHHRRTRLGYVCPAKLAAPGDKASAVPVFTDNDGHNTGLYLGALSLAYSLAGDAVRKQQAADAFRALVFLCEVTEGGSHPAPQGFIARAALPSSEADPNPLFDAEYDRRRRAADALWKEIQPRWPVDASGQWYWKNDSSSDELDGHFFGYALYFDRVCETEGERDAVRSVVRRIMDHILTHNLALVDHDGLPTRWARFSPDDLNRNEAWCDERGLNSFSILTYLSIAHHITGDPKYREAYLELALDQGYGMNGMTQPKSLPGPYAAGHQPDDNMAFMNYYHLIRYETDPKLLSMYYYAIRRHWQYERIERNPFANFVYAACCLGKTRSDHWGDEDLSPPLSSFWESIDALKRYPLDLINWPMSNAHRCDMRPLLNENGHPAGDGGGMDGQVFPIDERHETNWAFNPWLLTYDGDGTLLRDGVPYLLAYYLGRAHGFLAD